MKLSCNLTKRLSTPDCQNDSSSIRRRKASIFDSYSNILQKNKP
jgi:hypothetical protein